MSINPRTMRDGNFPDGDDSTAELIRKHKLYRREWERILKNEIKRGEDYWGGYDDSISNDLTDIEHWLYERAVLRRDRDANSYIYDNKVDGLYTISLWQTVIDKAVKALEEGGSTQEALRLLKSIQRDPFKPKDTEEA